VATFRTRGQVGATTIVRSFVDGGSPHAILFVGPPAVGKTTLALDLARGLLCVATDVGDRPCGGCRGCRMVDSGNHPDLHRLAPEGAGGQIGIGQVRALATALALLPVEGGARVALVEAAHRLNEDAQNALLKTLEEPPTGATILLCADDEERLLPTVRSRCARVRLGPVAIRDIEAILGARELADAPTAARLARLAAGRPGLAVAYARSPDAVTIRGEVARTLLDLLDAGRAARLTSIRELLGRATAATETLAGSAAAMDAVAARSSTTGRRRAKASAAPPAETEAAVATDGTGEPDGSAPARRSAAERRRATGWLLEVWRDVSRDLAVIGVADPRAVRDPGLIEEVGAAAARLHPGAAALFLARVARTAEQLDANISPELALDVLVLAWPRPAAP
jgi:DNA polymerase III delta' subunit